MEIDKSNGIVNYNDEKHTYWTKDSGDTCISVTTLIHKFTTFDEEFWSAYKAIERISAEDFKGIKPILLKNKVFKIEDLKTFNISEEEFTTIRGEILKEWAEKRDASCIRGTNIHRGFEVDNLAGKSKELKHLGLGGKFSTVINNKIEYGIKGVYPELLLSYISSDGVLRIAGQADLIIIDEGEVFVLDYKTNSKIDLKSFYDSKARKASTMKYPLNNIQDSNFWHYTMQLSTYAYMIQNIDPRFEIKKLTLIHIDHEDKVTYYDCEYLKNDVERMFQFYKQEVEYNKFIQKHAKVFNHGTS
jgi:hypothetical protein